jgi:hypothetical protein
VGPKVVEAKPVLQLIAQGCSSTQKHTQTHTGASRERQLMQSRQVATLTSGFVRGLSTVAQVLFCSASQHDTKCLGDLAEQLGKAVVEAGMHVYMCVDVRPWQCNV